MAHSLVGADLSHDQMKELHAPQKGLSARDQLAKYMGLTDLTQSSQAILLDLYSYTLQFGQELQLSHDKLSCLVSVVKRIHTRSTQDRLPVDKSFALFKDTLLRHSVQRPPSSVGVFTQSEFKQILEWGLDTYYRHYKLYQYAFTDRVILSVSATHPSDTVEVAQSLQPLQDAMTQEQYNEVVSQQEQERQAAEEAAAAARAEAAEAERVAKLREEYEAAVPDEIQERVQAAVEKEMILLKAAMANQFESQEKELLAKIASLEAVLKL